MKTRKYNYYKVIQQNFGYGQGWEDVTQHSCDSTGTVTTMSKEFKTLRNGSTRQLTELESDLKEYRENTSYPTRVILRREKI